MLLRCVLLHGLLIYGEDSLSLSLPSLEMVSTPAFDIIFIVFSISHSIPFVLDGDGLLLWVALPADHIYHS